MSEHMSDNRLRKNDDPDCDQPRAFTRRLVELQEAERRALSRDLHDTAGQAMTVLNLGLAMLRREEGCTERMYTRIDELRHVVETVGEDLRRLSVSLRPSSLDRYGLAAALEQLVASVRRQTGTGFNLHVALGDERLPGEVETALYRIVQEACTNITRYAAAAAVSVRVQLRDEVVEVIVEDDGRGFDVDEALQRGRLGLIGMAERAEMLGGSLVIESSPGHGTRLIAHVPVTDRGAEEADAMAAAGRVQGRPRGGMIGGIAGETPGAAANGTVSAAELARAKALSDVLVEIMTAAASCATAEEILPLVLTRSASAIACDTVHIDVRQGEGWVTRYDDRGLEAGHWYPDEAVPALVEVERTHAVLVVNDTGGEVPAEQLRLAEYGVRSYACVPLLANGGLQGVIAFINFSAPEPFSPSEIDFFNRLASLLSLALENVHLREIEARQRATLSERVEELEALLDVLPVGIGIAYDRECKNIKVNPAFAAMLGISSGANASLTADEAERPRNFRVLQEGREVAPEELPMQRAAAEGVELRELVVDIERDDGDTLTLLEYAVPLFDAQNQPRGSVGAFVDVTAQLAAAKKLAHRQLFGRTEVE
jgi:GAF domain-containing protein